MSDPKQEICDILYQFKDGESVLDVGCGEMKGSYHLGGSPHVVMYRYQNAFVCGIDLRNGIDWYDFEPDNYDIIIANDIFPNVDQRLELFLEKYLPHCKEMRLSLTYFDEPKWYRAKRVDGDEVLTMAAWNKNRILEIIKFKPRWNLQDFHGTFPNGRRVLLVWLKGGLA